MLNNPLISVNVTDHVTGRRHKLWPPALELATSVNHAVFCIDVSHSLMLCKAALRWISVLKEIYKYIWVDSSLYPHNSLPLWSRENSLWYVKRRNWLWLTLSSQRARSRDTSRRLDEDWHAVLCVHGLLPWVHLHRRSWLAQTGPSRTETESSGYDWLLCR